MISRAKLIGLRALEDVVKEIGIPFLKEKATKGSPTAKLIWAALETTINEGVDKIDGEVG